MKVSLEKYKHYSLATKLSVVILGMQSAFRYSVKTAGVDSGVDSATVVSHEVDKALDATLCAMRVESDKLVVNQRQPTLREHLIKQEIPMAFDSLDEGAIPLLEYVKTNIARGNIENITTDLRTMLYDKGMTVWCEQVGDPEKEPDKIPVDDNFAHNLRIAIEGSLSIKVSAVYQPGRSELQRIKPGSFLECTTYSKPYLYELLE